MNRLSDAVEASGTRTPRKSHVDRLWAAVIVLALVSAFNSVGWVVAIVTIDNARQDMGRDVTSVREETRTNRLVLCSQQPTPACCTDPDTAAAMTYCTEFGSGAHRPPSLRG